MTTESFTSACADECARATRSNAQLACIREIGGALAMSLYDLYEADEAILSDDPE